MPYNDLYRAYRPIPNIKPHPSHRVECNGHHRKRITTVPISRCPTINYVLTTPLRKTVNTVKRSVPTVPIFKRPTATVVLITWLGATAITVQGSVPYLSLDAKQQTTSRPPEFVPVNYVPTTQFRTMAIAVQRSVSYLSPDAKHQTTSQPPGWVQWPLP